MAGVMRNVLGLAVLFVAISLTVARYAIGEQTRGGVQMVQGYMVYRQDDVTVARGRVDGNVLIQDTDAIVVLQKTLDVLERNRGGELFIESGVYEINKSALVPGLVSVRGSGRSTVLKLGNENAEGVILIAKGKEGVVLSDFSC